MESVRERFCRYCRLFYRRNLVAGVGGNLAERVEKGILLSPSGVSLRAVRPDALVMVDENGRVLAGGLPTKDMPMHLAVLRARPEIRVVAHVHGIHLIAAAAGLKPGRDSLPPLTPGFVHFAYPLPLLPFLLPGSRNLAESVAEALSDPKTRAVLLQNHGLVVAGSDLEEALNVAEEIDEAAAVFVLSAGRARPIPAGQVDRIRRSGKSGA